MRSKQKHSLHDHIGYWLNKFGHEVQLSFVAKLASENITGPQWCILIGIYNGDARTVVDLGKFIGVDKGSISRVVDQLVARGLIEVQEHEDRRSKKLVLSKAGETLAIRLAHLADENDEQFFKILSQEEKRQLQAILKKLLMQIGLTAQGGWLK